MDEVKNYEKEQPKECDHFSKGLKKLPSGEYQCMGCSAVLKFVGREEEKKQVKIEKRSVEEILEDILSALKKISASLYYSSKYRRWKS